MSARRSPREGASRAAMPPQKMASHASLGEGQPRSTSSTRHPSSRKRRAAFSHDALTSGSTMRPKPRVDDQAARRPLIPFLSALT